MVCQDRSHAWELRSVSFEEGAGTVEELECRDCPAVTARESAAAAMGTLQS